MNETIKIVFVRGPNELVFSPSNDKAQVNATALTKGNYVFQLTAWNVAGFNSSDNVSVTVIQSKFYFIQFQIFWMKLFVTFRGKCQAGS